MARRQGRNREREGERKKGQRGEGKGGGEKYARSMGMRRPLRRAQWQVGGDEIEEARQRSREKGDGEEDKKKGRRGERGGGKEEMKRGRERRGTTRVPAKARGAGGGVRGSQNSVGR